MGQIAVKPPKSTVEQWEASDPNKRYHQQVADAAAEPTLLTSDVLYDDKHVKQEQHNVLEAVPIPAAAVARPERDVNTVQQVFEEDLMMIDTRQAARLPPFIKKEIERTSYREACRRCYEVEKKMAACLQSKLWTAWKCEKERDAYYACVESYEKSPEMMNDLRWKYNLGTYHGEIVARRRLMTHLWQEYFPDRDMHHQWAEE